MGHKGALAVEQASPVRDKPRLVFFRMLQPDLPGFIELHLREQVDCLSRFFDVVVISAECDYGEICERYQPDLTLFESGAYAGKRRITNTAAHPEVPRLGFIHSDAYCLSRAASISDMAQWGVDDFVSISVSMAEYTPEIADAMFVWPNFIDPGLYRDYGESKIVPVFFAGSQAIHYPWRNRINRTVSQAYPSMTTPHGGWFNKRRSARMIFGERYARMLNASSFVPTCGTIAKEVVRKHFEIPAVRSCLLTERAASLEAAGFVDMENCVFADEDDVLDKLDHLFANPEELARIIDAGHRMVHSRHTAAQRDEILQWYLLRQQLRPGQRISQPKPFAPLEIVEGGAGGRPVISGGLDRLLLGEGDEAMARGEYDRAENIFLRCLNYHFMPEPVLRLAACDLHRGRPGAAVDWLNQTIEGTLLTHRAADPDPVEWAYLVRALIGAGRLREAAGRARQYPALRHVELDRTRLAIGVLTGEPVSVEPATGRDRRSVHQLPELDLTAWIGEFATMMTACGQPRVAASLREHAASADRFQPIVEPAGAAGSGRPGKPAELLARGRLLSRKVRRRLDYELARRRPAGPAADPFIRRLSDLAEKEDISHALLLGAGSGPAHEALLAGLRANPNRPVIVTMDAPGVGGPEAAGPVVAARRGPADAPATTGPLPAIKSEYGIDAFDLVLAADSADADRAQLAELSGARFVMIDYINGRAGYEHCRRLLDDPRYLLVDHDPGHDTGYAIFRRGGTGGVDVDERPDAG